MILFAIFLFNMCYIYLSMKARVCDYRSYKVLREDYACELSMVESLQFRACFSLKHDPAGVGGKGARWGVRRLFLQWRPIKISKLFWPAKFAWLYVQARRDAAKNSHFVCEIAVPSLHHGKKCIYIMSWRRKRLLEMDFFWKIYTLWINYSMAHFGSILKTIDALALVYYDYYNTR